MLASFAKRPCFGLSYASKIDRFSSYFTHKIAAPLAKYLHNSNLAVEEMLSALSEPPTFTYPLSELQDLALGHRRLIEDAFHKSEKGVNS
jgi:hypothetical protein